MVRGEEKQFEITIDRLLEYTKNIKISLFIIIQRIENEGDNLDWPSVLDAFTSICGQINTLMRFTRENRSQFIENRVVLPILLTQDRDEELIKLTEGRVQVVNHEMVPDYLRTKPDPEIEEFDKSLQARAATINSDAAVKQIKAVQDLIENILATLKTNSVRADSEMARQALKPSYIPSETNDLIMAISSGRGLATAMPTHRMAMQIDSPSIGQPVVRQGGPKQNVKAPELKTNIKAGP